ncbi:MAG TPA: hypothetical protein VIV88_07075 [Gemmatimonadales bacterium]
MSAAQYAVTAAGVAAIVWVLWYFLLSKGSAAPAAGSADVRDEPATAEPHRAASPHTRHE